MAEHDHDHDHGNGQPHAGMEPPDDSAAAYYEKRAAAIEKLLIEKGVLSPEDIRRQIEMMDSKNPEGGARVVAKAWTDPEYRALVFKDARAALAQLDIDYGEMNVLVAVENTPEVHNVVVCTLCSCYPRPLLGLPPDWYKSLEYRSRTVVDPRGVLKEFGLDLSQDVEVRVHDSSADIRYLVIPERPAGTEGWSEQQLAELVTRDSMIGVTKALEPVAT